MLIFGKVTAIDEENARVKLVVPDMDEWETDWLFVPQACTVKDKSYNIPEINTLAAAILDEDMIDGCIIGALYNDVDTCILGDKNTKYIKFEDGSEFKYDKTTGICTIAAKNGFNFTGDINLDGSLTATGDISDKTSSMQDMRDIYNPHTHTCPDGTTSTPSGGM